MLEGETTEQLDDAETEFRRRLAQKLGARGYSGAALESKIEELLRKGVNLRLNVEEILRG
jgi:hypothetical protein